MFRLDPDIPYTPRVWLICDCGRRLSAYIGRATSCPCGTVARVVVVIEEVCTHRFDPEAPAPFCSTPGCYARKGQPSERLPCPVEVMASVEAL